VEPISETELLVIDVEATCWQGKTPPGEQSEIIEIGLCRVDLRTGELLETRGIWVKPERSKISAFCTELTTITPEMVVDGISFSDACALLETKYRAKERAWASYGDYDRKQFERQCESFGVLYPFGPRHYNIKRAFAREQGLPKQVGMAGALRHLGLPLEGTHHRGADDAANIARIATRLYQGGGLDALYAPPPSPPPTPAS
jgi:inhibitor of KinA sporulation pathway (predicted exonuclease)